MVPPPLSKLYGDCIRSAGNHPSCDDFFGRIRPVVARVASRIAYQYNSPDEVEDLIQEVNLKLIASGESILSLLPPDPNQALAYFSVIAANSARDFFRARNATKRGHGSAVSIDSPIATIAASLGLTRDLDRGVMIARIEEHLPTDRREQTIFRLYYRQGLTAREIASIPAMELSVKGVESLIFRITNQIRQRLNPALPPAEGKRQSKGIPS